jgi:tetratricopeptide (TPR) repeat protein
VRFAGVSKQEWQALLRRLSGIGLLTELGGRMYGLHPALPSYLMAEWRRLAGESFATEHTAAEQALLMAYAGYAGFGTWLLRQIESGTAEAAFGLLERQRRTMGRLLGVALAQQRYGEAQSLLQPLDEFWKARGLRQEARGWLDRCRAALEDRQGAPPDLTSEAGALWLFAMSSEANWAIRAGELDAAYRSCDAIRRQLEALPDGEQKQQRLAVTYHQLGIVAQQRGDLAVAEGWYSKSLEINEALGDRPGLAMNCGGMVSQIARDQ